MRDNRKKNKHNLGAFQALGKVKSVLFGDPTGMGVVTVTVQRLDDFNTKRLALSNES